MPEGDEIWRTAHRLHEALGGRALLAAELRWPNLSTAQLAGLIVDEALPRGKHILIRFGSGWTLHSHLRMDGSWVIERTDPARYTVTPARGGGRLRNGAGQSEPGGGTRGGRPAQGITTGVPERRSGRRPESRGGGFVRAVLVGEEWTALGVDLGMLDLVRTVDEHTLIGQLGPDLLDAGFDQELAVRNLRAATGTIGAALLDQHNLAGIGTIWASETLFAERVNPWARSVELPGTVVVALVGRARRLLSASVARGAPSATGSLRRGRNTYVHGRSGQPCRGCGGLVRVAQIGPPARERPMFYCPSCQGGLAPGDDGRPIAPLGARRGRW